MSGEGVVVEGADEAARAYQGIADDAKNMTEANRRIANAGADAARARAPVRTGTLAGSIEADADERAATLRIGVPYWPFQEFGTRYVRAQRFGKAGRDAMTAEAPDAYHDRMARIIASRT